eukprot:GSA25T00016380001.1
MTRTIAPRDLAPPDLERGDGLLSGSLGAGGTTATTSTSSRSPFTTTRRGDGTEESGGFLPSSSSTIGVPRP